MNRGVPGRVLVAIVLALVAGFFETQATADQRAVRYRTFADPAGRFTLEVPNEWIAITGAGAGAVTVVERSGAATVAVEAVRLQTPLAPDQVTDLFSQLEVEIVTERQPTASGVQATMVELNGLRVIVIDFSRRGVNGAERVRQYSVPRGGSLFRVTCQVPQESFARYEGICVHAGQSFRPGPVPVAPPGRGR